MLRASTDSTRSVSSSRRMRTDCVRSHRAAVTALHQLRCPKPTSAGAQGVREVALPSVASQPHRARAPAAAAAGPAAGSRSRPASNMARQAADRIAELPSSHHHVDELALHDDDLPGFAAFEEACARSRRPARPPSPRRRLHPGATLTRPRSLPFTCTTISIGSCTSAAGSALRQRVRHSSLPLPQLLPQLVGDVRHHRRQAHHRDLQRLLAHGARGRAAPPHPRHACQWRSAIP